MSYYTEIKRDMGLMAMKQHYNKVIPTLVQKEVTAQPSRMSRNPYYSPFDFYKSSENKIL